MMQGKGVVDATKEEILDSFKTKSMALELAMEAALTILRVDQVLVACTEFSSPSLPTGLFAFLLVLLLLSRSYCCCCEYSQIIMAKRAGGPKPGGGPGGHWDDTDNM